MHRTDLARLKSHKTSDLIKSVTFLSHKVKRPRKAGPDSEYLSLILNTKCTSNTRLDLSSDKLLSVHHCLLYVPGYGYVHMLL